MGRSDSSSEQLGKLKEVPDFDNKENEKDYNDYLDKQIAGVKKLAMTESMKNKSISNYENRRTDRAEYEKWLRQKGRMIKVAEKPQQQALAEKIDPAETLKEAVTGIEEDNSIKKDLKKEAAQRVEPLNESGKKVNDHFAETVRIKKEEGLKFFDAAKKAANERVARERKEKFDNLKQKVSSEHGEKLSERLNLFKDSMADDAEIELTETPEDNKALPENGESDTDIFIAPEPGVLDSETSNNLANWFAELEGQQQENG